VIHILAKIKDGAITELPVSKASRDEFLATGLNLMDTDSIAALGFVAVEAPPYVYDQYIYKLANPVQIDGAWKAEWVVDAAATQEDIAYKSSKEAKQVRETRNLLLSQCDWTQLPDSLVNKGAWAAYRQALRDLSTQAGFPWQITWPTQP